MDTALTERKALSIVLTGATRGPGLEVAAKLAHAGHKVSGSTVMTSDAVRLRELGVLPVYVDELRGTELASVLKNARADVLVDLGRQDINQTIDSVGWDAEEIIARAQAIVTAAKESGVKFIVYTSYAFVYGDAHGHEVDETAKPHTNGHPLLKAILKAEKLVLNSGVPACVLRLGYLYGPYMRQLQGVTTTLRRGRPVPMGDGLANYVYAADAAEAIRRAAEAQPAGEIFNITDGHPVSSAHFYSAFAESMGISAPSKFPSFLNSLFAGSVLRDLFGLSVKVNSSKAQTALGWSPNFPLKAGLSDTSLTWRAESL